MDPGGRALETPALLVIDMERDTLDERRGYPITPLARGLVPVLNRLVGRFRASQWPIVFTTDAFEPGDFLFGGALEPYSLRGTEGARVAAELDLREGDLWLPKRRFSAFFGTDLAAWLRGKGVTLCAIGGVSTPFCVLASALDALSHDFKAVILEDAVAAAPLRRHEALLEVYRRNPLFPLFRVMKSAELLAELGAQPV
ncbi:MAG: isochorismatase family cysteine hydrolase [Desulfobacterales bacterium]